MVLWQKVRLKALIIRIHHVFTFEDEGMTNYSDQEMADLHFIYRVSEENALKAGSLYVKEFSLDRFSAEKNA